MAMRPIALKVGLFANPADDPEDFTGLNRAHSERVIDGVLFAMVLANRLYLREHPRTPHLYQAQVAFHHLPPLGAFTDWRGIPGVLLSGYGDCKELAPWRCAELNEQGIKAQCHVRLVRPGLYHVTVRRAAEPRSLPPGQRVRPGTHWRGHRVILTNERGPTLYAARDGESWIEDPSRVCGMGGDGE